MNSHQVRQTSSAPKRRQVHRRPSERQAGSKHRASALVLSAAIVLTLGIGGTIAYLSSETDAVSNLFAPAEVTCQIDESFAEGETVKSGVHVHNTGDVDAYIRAAIVVTWQNSAGHVLGESPKEGTHYELKLAEDSGWVKAPTDGYYYYTVPVAPDAPLGSSDEIGAEDCTNNEDGSTKILVESCTAKSEAPVPGYTLHVEVIASAIQAHGVDDDNASAVANAWGTGVSGIDDDHNLIVKAVSAGA